MQMTKEEPNEKNQEYGKQALKQEVFNADAPPRGADARRDPHSFLDKLLARFLLLSNRAKVAFINSIFGYSFLPESKVLFLLPKSAELSDFTEHLSNAVIKVADKYFSIQLALGDEQAAPDHRCQVNCVMLTAEHDGSKTIFGYPEIAVIYLGSGDSSYALSINYKGDTALETDMPVLKPTEMAIDEMVSRKLTFLLPLHMIKFRQYMDQNGKTEDVTRSELQRLILFEAADAISGIKRGHSLGRFDDKDKLLILSMMSDVCNHFYPGFEKVEKLLDTLDLSGLDRE
jgi:hypothetical protein